MPSPNIPKPGFIFIPDESVTAFPAEYRAKWCGATGFWARLTDQSCNGWETVPVAAYEYARRIEQAQGS